MTDKKQKLVEIDEELNLDDAKFKVTLYLDGDVLRRAREEAAKQKMKYQPYLNRLLREILLGEKSSLEERVSRLEELIERKLG
jgi:predicted DNA binding CopG/RHH family protein